jgi:proteasome lid subunit RPN8/RPN11
MPLCHLPSSLLGRIQEEARGAFPLEACGLLLGRRNVDAITIDELVMSANVASGDRRRRFMIDPQLQFETLRALRGTGRDVIGVFHSHPGGEPFPSQSDAEMAIEAEFVWVIVSVDEDGKTRARAHLAIGDSAGFNLVQLAIEP